MKFFIKNEAATSKFASIVAAHIPEKALVFLNGPLGAGKTTLVRETLVSLGHQGGTKSPTYTLVEPYTIKGRKVFHFDLYRLSDPEELEYIGIRDYLDENAICLVEWPERGAGFITKPDLVLNLNYEGEARSITLGDIEVAWALNLSQELKRSWTD